MPRIAAVAQLALGLCLAAGCGGNSNTVEMPATPAPPPSSSPVVADPGGSAGQPAGAAAGTAELSAPAAVAP